MSRKDFELIATTIKSLPNRDQNAVAFADALRSTNPLFDRDRFLRACGAATTVKVVAA